MITKQQIVRDLINLGVKSGDSVMMHSSLSALGIVEGGADAVVDALLEAVGPKGTLLVPAFRDSVWGNAEDFSISDCTSCRKNNLCLSQQCGFQGIISETVRKRPGSLRSCHPTHSWVALGPMAEFLLKGHRASLTPCGKGNPFEALVELGGIILTLGVGVNTITLWHYFEEALFVPYLGHYWPDERHLNHCVPGRRIQYEFPGIMQDVCRATGILTEGPVGKSSSGLIRAKTFKSFMATIMADNLYCMVLRPPDRYRRNLAIDALNKASAMIKAWEEGPQPAPSPFDNKPKRIEPAGPGDVVREDCPAFAGWHKAGDQSIALCRANGRHPDYFRRGGIFNECGLSTCGVCSWHNSFPL